MTLVNEWNITNEIFFRNLYKYIYLLVQVTGRPRTGQDPHDRVATPTRPPRYTHTYSASGKSTPTISENGVEGDKSYVKITTPLHQTIKYETPDIKMFRSNEHRGRVVPPYKENKTRLNNTPADISSVTLVGKAPPLERVSRGGQKPTEETATNQSQETAVEEHSAATSLDEQMQLPSRLDINIPAVDMISASSAAVNSITDFLEFDNSSGKPRIEGYIIKGKNIDVNNNHSADVADDRYSESSYRKPPSIDSFNSDQEEFSISVDIKNERSTPK